MLKLRRVRNLFAKRKKSSTGKIVNYPEISSLDATTYESVYTGETDYILVKNFISPDELVKANARLEQARRNAPLMHEVQGSRSFIGIPILEATDSEQYFNVADICNERQEEMLGFSFNRRVEAILKHLSGLDRIEIPVSRNGRSYLGNIIRVLNRNFYHHCDKQFHDIHPMTDELNAMSDPENTISVYAVLKNPEKGGRLYTYDILMRDTPQHILEDNLNGNFLPVRRYVERFPVQKINVEEGDLIIFGGGQKWHMIEPIKSDHPRITIGCITNYSAANDRIYYWE